MTFIVVWVEDGGATDSWAAFDSMESARALYDDLVERGFYTVSLCKPIVSTDYACEGEAAA